MVSLIIVVSTIVNAALPPIAEDLGSSSTQVQWVLEACTLVFAALLLLFGTLRAPQEPRWRGRAPAGAVVPFADRARRRRRAGAAALLELSSSRIVSFRNGSIMVLMVSLGEFGIIFSLLFWLQFVLGFGALQAGLVLARPGRDGKVISWCSVKGASRTRREFLMAELGQGRQQRGDEEWADRDLCVTGRARDPDAVGVRRECQGVAVGIAQLKGSHGVSWGGHRYSSGVAWHGAAQSAEHRAQSHKGVGWFVADSPSGGWTRSPGSPASPVGRILRRGCGDLIPAVTSGVARRAPTARGLPAQRLPAWPTGRSRCC